MYSILYASSTKPISSIISLTRPLFYFMTLSDLWSLKVIPATVSLYVILRLPIINKTEHVMQIISLSGTTSIGFLELNYLQYSNTVTTNVVPKFRWNIEILSSTVVLGTDKWWEIFWDCGKLGADSQWRTSRRTGVVCSCLPRPTTRRAAALSTICPPDHSRRTWLQGLRQ